MGTKSSLVVVLAVNWIPPIIILKYVNDFLNLCDIWYVYMCDSNFCAILRILLLLSTLIFYFLVLLYIKRLLNSPQGWMERIIFGFSIRLQKLFNRRPTDRPSFDYPSKQVKRIKTSKEIIKLRMCQPQYAPHKHHSRLHSKFFSHLERRHAGGRKKRSAKRESEKKWKWSESKGRIKITWIGFWKMLNSGHRQEKRFHILERIQVSRLSCEIRRV